MRYELLSTVPRVKWSEPVWSSITTLGAGLGAARLAEPEDEAALVRLLELCHASAIPVLVLGAGSNMVGSDASLDSVVIRLSAAKFAEISFGRSRRVAVGAGASLAGLLRKCAEKGLGGFAALAPIPGTLGGALKMNAGADGLETSGFAVELFGLRPDGSLWSARGDEIEWGYRTSGIPSDVILTSAICEFREVDAERELREITSAFSKRKARQPSGRSAGCVFGNPAPDVLAGYLMERSGLAKLTEGAFEISDTHCNFIINTASSSSEKDFLALAKTAKTAVFKDSGIVLKPEVEFANPTSAAVLERCVEPPNVVVLKGGDSNEREVSLHSAEGVESALRNAGWQVAGVDVANLADAESLFSENDPRLTFERGSFVVFPVLHGGFGEDGRLQAMLERVAVPFVGSPSKACAVAMDKERSKKLMEANGIPTPAYASLERGETEFPCELSLPVVVKPPTEGSTVGISIVRDLDEWGSALDEAFKYSANVLVEEFVEGVEATVGIVDGEALPVVEIRFPGEIFDFDAKYDHKLGETLYLCPPETISEEVQSEVRRTALEFAKAIDSTALTRIDFIVDADGIPWVLEANNLPGFTSSSLLPKAAASAGLPFPMLCAKLLNSAIKRHSRSARKNF